MDPELVEYLMPFNALDADIVEEYNNSEDGAGTDEEAPASDLEDSEDDDDDGKNFQFQKS